MTIYICKECGYRFETERPKSCPYCSSVKVKREETAEELLSEVDSE